MTTATPAAESGGGGTPKRRFDWRRASLHGFLVAISVIWLLPLLYVVYTSLRPFSDTAQNGYLSVASTLTLANFQNAWTDGDLLRHFFNTAIIVIPTVIIVLFLASMLAFVLARYSFKFNLAMLLLFVGLNMLPPQVLITPLYQIYRRFPDLLYDQFLGIVIVHVAFQLGFCAFVLSNYMKTIPREINEAALVDGASAWKTFYRLILPHTRPALAALAVLQVTWIYNDFFWALFLMGTCDNFPVTSALNILKGV